MTRVVKWSRYNFLFRSERFGYFIYNSLSNAFIELDAEHFQRLERLKKEPESASGTIDSEFLLLLEREKILVGENDEAFEINHRHGQRQSLIADGKRLALTICPTLGCNFRCPYCFEQTQESTAIMSAETVNRLLWFIKKFSDSNSLSITWYGGEPTIAIGLIRQITKRVEELDIEFVDAGLITNGYLLDDVIISDLNALHIQSVQITLDGPERIHNRRRFLIGGEGTYRRIMDNIALLMTSSYSGWCHIRVNIDHENMSAFFELRKSLLDLYQGKKLNVYSGNIEETGRKKSNKCGVCEEEWMDFTLRQYRDSTANGRERIYPRSKVFNICSANSGNSFVVGPEGELYKCWEDVGFPEMVIGTLYAEDVFTNPDLVAQYGCGTDPYLDSTCRDCRVLPICSGGCPKRRLTAKFIQVKEADFCTLYKRSLIKCLLEYYDTFLTREICADLLNPRPGFVSRPPYRTIYSETKNCPRDELKNLRA